MKKIICDHEETLTDYLEGRLSEDEKSRIAEHISDCEICLATVIIGKSLVWEKTDFELDPVPDDVTQASVELITGGDVVSFAPPGEKIGRAVRGLYQRASDFFNSMHQEKLAYAPVRGARKVMSDDIFFIRKTFEKIDTEIEIEKTGEEKAQIRLKFHHIDGALENIRATLKKDERELSSNLMNIKDYTLFEDIPFGRYNLTFFKDGVELGSYLFQIRDTRHTKK